MIELFIRMNRRRAIGLEVSHWLVGAEPKDLIGLKTEQQRLIQEYDSFNEVVKKRWGSKHKGLVQLSPQVADVAKAVEKATNKAVTTALATGSAMLNADCDALRARVEKEVPPVVIPALKEFNRRTVEGEAAYQEDRIRRPLLIKVADAERALKVAKRIEAEIPIAWRKRIEETHATCVSAIKSLEEELVRFKSP